MLRDAGIKPIDSGIEIHSRLAPANGTTPRWGRSAARSAWITQAFLSTWRSLWLCGP